MEHLFQKPIVLFLKFLGHPWQYGSLMWMHNGHVAEFKKVTSYNFEIKRSLQNMIKEEFFLMVQGNTDSEWIFSLFLSLVCFVLFLA